MSKEQIDMDGIKLRVWVPEDNRYYFVQLQAGSLTLNGNDIQQLNAEKLDDSQPWERATGFFDKHDQEIYEGDLVRLDGTDTYLVKWDTHTGKLALAPLQAGPEHPWWELNKEGMTYEIVGNRNQSD